MVKYLLGIDDRGIPVPYLPTTGQLRWVVFPYDPCFNGGAHLPFSNQAGIVHLLDDVPLTGDEAHGPYSSSIGKMQPQGGCPQMAGSARPGRALYKKQYWEVEIVTLPTSVPATTIHRDMGSKGTASIAWQTKDDKTFHWVRDDGKNKEHYGDGKLRWPLPNPGAGGNSTLESPVWKFVISSTALDEHGQFTQAIDLTYQYPPELNTFFNPVIGLWPKCPQFSKNDILCLDNLGASVRSIGLVPTSTMCGQLVATEDLTGTMKKRGGGTVDSTMTPKPPLNHLYGDLFRAMDVTTGDRNEMGGWMKTPPPKGDCAFVGDGGVMLPFGADLPGIGQTSYHSLVFKGNAGRLGSIRSPSVDSSIGDHCDGLWTGADLGRLNVGDIVMIATDTKTRGVWFGKNGNWYNGADPASGGGWTVMMDGAQDTRNYYPGVSYRRGPTKLRFRMLKKDCKYKPPKGFAYYQARF